VTTTIKPKLDACQQARLDRARQALAASQAETDSARYPWHAGALEVTLADVIRLAEDLAGLNGHSPG
jgi:hypothetical protein